LQPYEPGASSRLILVVEDEPAVRVSAIMAIEALGHRTLEAEDAASALALLEQQSQIDLLFTDVRMPGDMDGAELAFTVKSRWPSIAIIVVSGNFDPKATRLPMGTNFLAKPYRLSALKALIDGQLGNVGDQRLRAGNG
jgi:CheY-like chemotaxis protein